ncbi:MAG TPA: Asp-tRNA(Asn)/Glu-tRNA(Gln) amidotransferase subunit GatC [Pyrinomonadaceae bacterium]|nr:Asp-tRNA(Asn)/Glu-tRNA(Gln) amidotransferase subunit GatC [Pyrinomonadaceae bacterium]
MDVKHIAKLAHIEISEEEAKIYSAQMEKIVKYVEQLNELDTSGVEPMLGGLTAEGEATETIREDEPHQSFSQREALSQAPLSGEGFFKAPKIL